MTRVIHTGDTHIGYRQYHSAERRADYLEAFRQVVRDAIDDEVDAVVHAGDLFHTRRPDLPDLLGTIEVLRSLASAEIPFLAIVGNHDRTHGDQWLDLFSRLGLATRLDDTGTEIGDVTFYGLDHVPASRRDELEYTFDPPSTDHSALVAHGLFEPFVHANWDTESLLERATVDFDAVLLGDNHTPGRADVDGTWVTYCGSTERTSAREREERGYNIVSFDGDVQISRRAIDTTRRFEFIDVELEEDEGVDRVLERVGQYDLDDAVAIVTIAGSGRDIAPAEIETFAKERGAIVARVTDARDVETDADVEVTFADPDQAVREQLRTLGLSAAATEIDELVRQSGLADANVRDATVERVRSTLEAELSAFDPRPTDEGAGSTDADRSESTPGSTDPDGEGDETTADGPTVDPETPDERAASERAVGADEGDRPRSTAGNDQTSMEEYL